jgi:phage tail sheath protein FI
MSVALTYPGVYIREVASGERTITGVSTSVTAFIGQARRGPINEAVQLHSFADFERRFGGLERNSDLSYAVRQFFLNGGSDAWVVRIAKDATRAVQPLAREAGGNVLELTARNAGRAGNDIAYRIDHDSPSTFSLGLRYAPPDNPGDTIVERMPNLSMNPDNPRYVVTMVRDESSLVTAQDITTQAMLNALPAGTSVSRPLVDAGGQLLDVSTLLDASHTQFRVAVNGLPPVTVQLTPGVDDAGANPAARLDTLAAAIQALVRAQANGEQALAQFTGARNNNTIVLTSGVAGVRSSVRVLPGLRNDVSVRLGLGQAAGGTETDGAAGVRPAQVPDPGRLTSGVFANAAELDNLPSAAANSLTISLDGSPPATVSLGSAAAAGANLADRLADIANRLQTAVRAFRPSVEAFRNFTVTVQGGNRLVLTSGTRGTGSSVHVTAAATNSIADQLHLLAGATSTPGLDVRLTGGNESPFDENDPDYFSLFVGSRAAREGLYALEALDLFNLLCLPNVTDGGILMEAAAYCEERHAFLIADPPRTVDSPAEARQLIVGPTLPKTDHGAVYFPWITIADPLNGGRPRNVPPSGTIAGLYARTDSSRGVWKAPAGIEASLTGAQGASYVLSDPENGDLNPLGVNCIRVFPIFGTVAWGARTLQGADAFTSEYKYIPIRRLANYIELSALRGTQWVVFEPNDEPLWAQIRLNLGAFMHNLFRQGAFQGQSPRDAYFVKCDSETTTQNDINLGIVNIVIGFAPLKPAEFVVITVQQIARPVQV